MNPVEADGLRPSRSERPEAGRSTGRFGCLRQTHQPEPCDVAVRRKRDDKLTAMWKRTLAVAGLLSIVPLSACASGATSTPSKEAGETPAVEESSTVEQWASLIAQQSVDWDEWKAEWDDATCSSIAAAEGAMDCNLMLTSAMYMLQTTSIELEPATSEGKKGFIASEPPAEVANLYAATEEAAPSGAAAAKAWQDANCGLSTSGEECGGLSSDLETTVDDLMSEYAAWGPYL